MVFIPVTRRVKGYTRFVGKYVTGRSQIDLTMSVCPDERWDFGNYKSQAIEIWHADSGHEHFNAQKPPKTVAPTVLMLE